MDKAQIQQRIQELLNRLDVLQGKKTLTEAVDFLLDTDTPASLKESPAGKAISQIASHVGKMNIDPRLLELETAIKSSKEENQGSLEELAGNFSDNMNALLEEIRGTETRGTELTKVEITSIAERLDGHEMDFSDGIRGLASKNALIEAEVQRIAGELPRIFADVDAVDSKFLPLLERIGTTDSSLAGLTKSGEGVVAALEELKSTVFARLAALNNNHGGNMNRNIAIGGNTSVLARYTDINLKAGANVTITYANNDQTKYTDITIAATGGSGSGIVRSVNSVAVNTAAGAVPTTDYVYLASGTLTITLPTSVGNSNLYTIKNIGAGVITIVTTGGELIDGSANLILPLQFTSVDLISNNSGNWDIT